MKNIETERLIITAFDLRYLKEYYEGFDAEITEYQYPNPFETEDDARQVLQQFIDMMNRGEMLFMAVLTKDNVFAGSIEVHGLMEEQPEIGLWIKKKFQNRGYAYEALSQVMEMASRDFHKEWYIYEADIRNKGSIKLAEKFIYRKVGFDEFTTGTGKELKLQKYIIR